MKRNIIKTGSWSAMVVTVSFFGVSNASAQSAITSPNAPILHGVIREGKEIKINYSYTHNLGPIPVEIQFFSGTPSDGGCVKNGQITSVSAVVSDVIAQNVLFANDLELPSCFVARAVAADQETESANSNTVSLYREQAAPTPEQSTPQVLAATTEEPEPQVKAAATLVDTGTSSLASIIASCFLLLSTVAIWAVSRRTNTTS